MLEKLRWTFVPLLSFLLVACIGGLLPGGDSDSSAPDELPTTTPIPIQDSLDATSTPLPPPTPTPFPTVTPEDGVAEEASDTPTEEAGGDDATEPDETTTEEPDDGSDDQIVIPGINPDIPLGLRAYVSDFSSPGWLTIESDTANAEVVAGAYIWEIGPVDAVWINTGFLDVTDFYAQVTVNVDNCPNDAGYGMRFRLTDGDNYYFFAIFCDDSYSVAGEETGPTHYTYISRTDLPDSLSGNAESTHVIGVLAQGSQFTLYMDGIELASFEDEDSIHSSGDVAMWALSPGAGILRLIFDDLEVYDLDVR